MIPSTTVGGAPSKEYMNRYGEMQIEKYLIPFDLL
jgi:hypothetical protein